MDSGRSLFGIEVHLAARLTFGLSPKSRNFAKREVCRTWRHTQDPRRHPRAGVIYTDVWVAWDARRGTGSSQKMALSGGFGNSCLAGKLLVHALYARPSGRRGCPRGARCPQAILFDQAENRLHMQKSILRKISASTKKLTLVTHENHTCLFGGLDTSVLVHWYANEQMRRSSPTAPAWDKRKNSTVWRKKPSPPGHRPPNLDLVDEFADDFIYPMVREMPFTNPNTFSAPRSPPSYRQGADRDGREFEPRSRPRGNRQRKRPMQFELTFSALAPDLQILAPWRDASFRKKFPGRKEMIEYCAEHKIGVEASASNLTPWTGTSGTFHTRPVFWRILV